MFSGIVQATGKVWQKEVTGGSMRLEIDLCSLGSQIRSGESMAVNGCCLTVEELKGERGRFLLLEETQRATNLSSLEVGSCVNLERALRLGDPVGGHWVTGHVDGVGHILALEKRNGEFWLEVELLEAWRPYAVPKGSVAVDGISLTVVSVAKDRFSMAVTPFTYHHTNLCTRVAGQPVNVEWDLIAKYLWHMLEYRSCQNGVSFAGG
ncbi:riboflavin synthase [Candidatus Methylacidithermus pantelleriae]|uniref:Riboflavin synthase n=1 Tax=Candidatus Methylacidithermus pantelleriae TaxID=2744239 RepID=A0A8J2BV77_9BACT|nr:riboflavin synthase [Candidatus Methylacidithermus pantelleriae]CAF0703474.1 Riboflavin synthase alpha chain [Candidatus Methylacidithermus pantelleriae]